MPIFLFLLLAVNAQAADSTKCEDCKLIQEQLQTRQAESTDLKNLLERNRQFHESLPSRRRSATLKVESNMKLIQVKQSEAKSQEEALMKAQGEKGCSQCP